MFYNVNCNANLLPVVGDPSFAPIDVVAYNENNIQITAPIVNGVQYSIICLADKDALDAFLATNNLILDTEANYYFNLP